MLIKHVGIDIASAFSQFGFELYDIEHEIGVCMEQQLGKYIFLTWKLIYNQFNFSQRFLFKFSSRE